MKAPNLQIFPSFVCFGHKLRNITDGNISYSTFTLLVFVYRFIQINIYKEKYIYAKKSIKFLNVVSLYMIFTGVSYFLY